MSMSAFFCKYDARNFEDFAEPCEPREEPPKFAAFLKWADEHGIIAPRVSFPARFGKAGLLGIACKEKIGFNEGFCFVPTNLIIRSDRIKDTEIGQVLEEFKEEIEENARDVDHFYMLAFLLYEQCKGEESLWYPYFSIMSDDIVLPYQWPADEIQQLEDELLIDEVLTYKDDVNKECVMLQRISKKHKDYFPPEKVTKNLIIQCTNILLTRAFGLGLNFTMLVPFADSCNHYNVDSGCDLFCPKLHQISLQDFSNPAYFDAKEYKNKERMETIFSDYYKAKSIEEPAFPDTIKEKLKKSHNNYWNKVENRQKVLNTPIDSFKEENSKDIWRCEFSSSTDTEDDEEEGSEGDAYDIVDEASKKVEDEESKTTKTYLIADEDRYAYKYTYDTQQKPLLIIQDRKQWKKRSFSCSFKSRENRYELIRDEYLDRQPKSHESSSTSSEEVETNGWLRTNYDESYFVLSTGKFKGYQPGEQIFNCYGSRSNRFLLSNYGFMLKYNSYNSLTFRAWVDHPIPEDKRITHIKNEEMNFQGTNQVIRWFKVIRLKEKFNFKLLEYIRSTLIDKYIGNNHQLLVVSSPIDFDFEILVVSSAVSLLESLLKKRFTHPGTDLENVLLGKEKLAYNK